MSVCLFVYPFIPHEPLDQFASNFTRGTRKREPRECSKLGLDILSLVGFLLGKIANLVIYDQSRLNGWSNYEYPGPIIIESLF